MKRILSGFLRSLAALTLVAVPLGFFFSGSVISRALDAALRLRVSPVFTGGRELARVYDAAGDDKGPGSLVYPAGDRFATPGSLDIVKYVVYEPVTVGRWTDNDYWQIGLTLAAMPNPDGLEAGFSLPSIRIYVDTDGAASGSLETAKPRSELVGFDPAFPWDVCIEIDGWREKARLVTASGVERGLDIIVLPETASLWVRLPLELPEVECVLDGRPTRHYVMTLASDPVLASGAMPVKTTATQTSGGGAASELTPRVYDILAAGRGNQERMLSSFDEGAYRYATISPIEMRAADAGADSAENGERLSALAKAADEEAKANMAEGKRRADEALAKAADPVALGIALFDLGRFEEAGNAFARALSEAPDPSPERTIAMAYTGSLAAMRGGRSGDMMEAMRLVNEAFVLLDDAVERGERGYAGDQGYTGALAAALANRANVAASVPNEVFQKGAVAAADFMRAAELASSRGDTKAAASLWIMAGRTLEAIGKDGATAFLRAASSPELSAGDRYELAKRGFLE